MFKRLLIGILSLGLISCGTMKSSDPTEEKVEKNNTKIAEINIQLGLAYLNNGNIQRAKQKLLYALQVAPQLPEAWYTMANFLERTGNDADAQRDYLKAIQLAPNRGDVQNNYGTYLCRTGRYTEAVQHFILATKDPTYLDTAAAYENAGLCSLKIPNSTQAKIYFKQSVKEDPSRVTPQLELDKLNKHENEVDD